MSESLSPPIRTLSIVEAGIRDGLQIGAQGYVSRNGRAVFDFAVGEAAPGVPMTGGAVMLWLSSSKPVAAAAILQLCEAGRLQLDDPVALHIPEFAANGKDAVAVRHLLTHTCGFRFIDLGDATTPWDEIIRRICLAPLEKNWVPGERAGYHPYTSWYVLGELVARLSGVSFSQYVRERIFLPLGMNDCWIGMPPEVRDGYGARLGVLVNTEKHDAAGRPLLTPYVWSTPEGIVACAPGGNGHGPMRQLSRFYEMLLGGGERAGVRILSTESVRQMTARQRIGLKDETFRHDLDWGLGVIPNNRRHGVDTVPYGYGRHASDEAFGHSGSQSSVAFADPQHGLAVAIVFNGMCGERRHQSRMRAVLDALYEDLGITRDD
jgi:CubicO group peptidase (beta-lactamase class C family)